MKPVSFKSLAITFLLITLTSGIASSQTNLYEELRSLSAIAQLPHFDDNAIVHQVSSYDTTGGNDDGFSGKYSFLRREGDALVIADMKGPGVIRRIWTPTPAEDTIQFFFDGEKEPRISVRFIDLFTGNVYPFAKPVCGNEVGGYYCYLPIPFSGSCKILFKGKTMMFIQIDYRELPGKQVTSFPLSLSDIERSALAEALKKWKMHGMNIMNVSDESEVVDVKLKAGEGLIIYKDNKGGRIKGIEITPSSPLNDSFKDVFIVARWDDDPVPAIICPLSDFFGYAFGKPSMQSLVAGVTGNLHYCYLPMPYSKKAVIELHYLENELNMSDEVSFKAKIYFSDEKSANDEGKLYTKWRREISPETGKPYTILETQGRGHYVGTILQAQGLNHGITNFFEGDDECYIDGELRLHGTGSEDYFNGGWYALPDRWDQGYSLPLHGALAYSIPLARTGGYRFYLNDKIPFNRDFRLTIEHGPEGNNIPVDYTSVAFWYSDTPPKENSLPEDRLLGKIQPPALMEYWLALLPVNAFNRGTITKERWTDHNNKAYDVIKYSAGENGFIKFELEVPEPGSYRIYMSFFKGPDCGDFQVYQRQIPVSGIIDATAEQNILVEKQLIGDLLITEGTNTVTVFIREKAGPSGNRSFALNKIFLERE